MGCIGQMQNQTGDKETDGKRWSRRIVNSETMKRKRESVNPIQMSQRLGTNETGGRIKNRERVCVNEEVQVFFSSFFSLP